jgi:hypothetical protein
MGEVLVKISEERPMTRLESAAWTLASGSVTVFALSAVLRGQPWLSAFLAIAVVVTLWARRAPLVAGMALGVVGWLFLTGFDVNSLGNLWLSGMGDVVRLLVLIAVAPAVALAGRLLWPGERDNMDADMPGPPEDQVWVTPHRLMGIGGRAVSSEVPGADRYRRTTAAAPHLGPRSRGMRNGTTH